MRKKHAAELAAAEAARPVSIMPAIYGGGMGGVPVESKYMSGTDAFGGESRFPGGMPFEVGSARSPRPAARQLENDGGVQVQPEFGSSRGEESPSGRR